MQGITKSFPGVKALESVDFGVDRGEVVALIGENGAGKSTLMKVLGGVHQPDAGEIRIDGQAVAIDTVHEAIARGVALIHQERTLAPKLNVAENMFLGHEPRWSAWVPMLNRTILHRRAREVAARVGLRVNTRLAVERLAPGPRQMVEIARALSLDARILIMDEPTSSLSQRETETLFGMIRELKGQGVGIVYISHRLSEVCEVADRVVVLRDGRNAGELARDEATHDRMVKLMVGRDVSRYYSREHQPRKEVVLSLSNVVVGGHSNRLITFTLCRGEVLTLAGLVGAGRTEIARALFGIDPILDGIVRLEGRPIRIDGPMSAIRQGFALVPEDRQLQGLILDMTVRQNISLAELGMLHSWGFWNRSAEERKALAMARRLNIRAPSLYQRARNLSGGNQQKVVLAKWLSLAPKVLILDEPTRGVDVGAKQEIYNLISELAAAGVAILMISSEMEEVLGMSDRVVVIHEGGVAGELRRDALSEEAIVTLATGKRLAA
jgi:ribose transport system ATP-binding protein